MKIRIRDVMIGTVLGLLLAVTRIAILQNKELEELEEALAKINEPVAAVQTVSFKEQVMSDIEKQYAEITVASEEPKKAPYNFISLEDELQIYLEERCNDLGIDVFFALALMESESGFNTEATGDSGRSVGLFQINKVWWDVMKESHGLDVFDPRDNIDAGLIIITDLMARYPDDLIPVVQCYKCGDYRGEELMKEGIIISACQLVLDRAEELRKMKEA